MKLAINLVRVCIIRCISDFCGLSHLGHVLTESEGLEDAYENISKVLDAMNEEWEEISQKYRYQGENHFLYDIVENFLQNQVEHNQNNEG